MRADPQNLPANLTHPWPGADYTNFDKNDHNNTYIKRTKIYDFIRDHRITNFATVTNDRHSFWAKLATKTLPPQTFKPIGIAFVTDSISAPGEIETIEHLFPKQHPLRPLFLNQSTNNAKPQPTINMLLHHNVHSYLEYQKTKNITKTRATSNPTLSPHLSFINMNSHDYVIVNASNTSFKTKFVYIPRPLKRTPSEDGDPIVYRVQHSAKL